MGDIGSGITRKIARVLVKRSIFSELQGHSNLNN